MIEFNVSGLNEVVSKLNEFDTDKMLYEIAVDVRGEIGKRVHERGENSDGSQIGTYSKGYMKVRTDGFQSPKIARGKRKGQKRPVFNRENSKKVILSLTSQMERDLAGTPPIKTERGYGIGFSNPDNYDKARWNEDRYGKPIWEVSEKEMQMAKNIVEKHIQKIND